LITYNGAPPTVAAKYEFVHNDGNRDFNHGNSSRNTPDERPLIAFTN